MSALQGIRYWSKQLQKAKRSNLHHGISIVLREADKLPEEDRQKLNTIPWRELEDYRYPWTWIGISDQQAQVDAAMMTSAVVREQVRRAINIYRAREGWDPLDDNEEETA